MFRLAGFRNTDVQKRFRAFPFPEATNYIWHMIHTHRGCTNTRARSPTPEEASVRCLKRARAGQSTHALHAAPRERKRESFFLWRCWKIFNARRASQCRQSILWSGVESSLPTPCETYLANIQSTPDAAFLLAFRTPIHAA